MHGGLLRVAMTGLVLGWRRNLWALAVMGMLVGCQTPGPLDERAMFDPSSAEGLVIVSMVSRTAGGTALFTGPAVFAGYDPETRSITGMSGVASGVVYRNGFVFHNLPLSRQQRFRAYKLPPGEYALVMLQSIRNNSFSNMLFVEESPFRVRDNTPVFSVKAGQASYIGELFVDMRVFPAELSMRDNELGLADFLQTMPGLDARVATNRPLVSFGETPRQPN
jgi:hypothetical protein